MNKSMITGITLGVATVAVGVGVVFNFMGDRGDAVYSPSVFDDQQYKISQQDNIKYGESGVNIDGSTIHQTSEIAGRQIRDYEQTYSQEIAPRGETGQDGVDGKTSGIDGKAGGGGYSSDIAVGTEADIQKQLTDMEKMSADAQKQAKMNQSESQDTSMLGKLKSGIGNIFGGGKSQTTGTTTSGVPPPSKGELPPGVAGQTADMDTNLKEIERVSKGIDVQRGRTGSFSQGESSTTDTTTQKPKPGEIKTDYTGTTDLKIVQDLTAKQAAKGKEDLNPAAGYDPFMGKGDDGMYSVDNLQYTSPDQILTGLDDDLYDSEVERVTQNLEDKEEEANEQRKKHQTNCIILASVALVAIVAFGIFGKALTKIGPWGYVAIAAIVLVILALILWLVSEATKLSQYSGDAAGIFMAISSLLTLGLLLVLTEVILNLPNLATAVISAVGTFLADIGSGAVQSSTQKNMQEDNKDQGGG